MSERRACQASGIARSTLRYRRVARDDSGVITFIQSHMALNPRHALRHALGRCVAHARGDQALLDVVLPRIHQVGAGSADCRPCRPAEPTAQRTGCRVQRHAVHAAFLPFVDLDLQSLLFDGIGLVPQLLRQRALLRTRITRHRLGCLAAEGLGDQGLRRNLFLHRLLVEDALDAGLGIRAADRLVARDAADARRGGAAGVTRISPHARTQPVHGQVLADRARARAERTARAGTDGHAGARAALLAGVGADVLQAFDLEVAAHLGLDGVGLDECALQRGVVGALNPHRVASGDVGVGVGARRWRPPS